MSRKKFSDSKNKHIIIAVFKIIEIVKTRLICSLLQRLAVLYARFCILLLCLLFPNDYSALQQRRHVIITNVRTMSISYRDKLAMTPVMGSRCSDDGYCLREVGSDKQVCSFGIILASDVFAFISFGVNRIELVNCYYWIVDQYMRL